MDKLLILFFIIMSSTTVFSQFRFRVGKAGCNPACLNGGTCARKVKNGNVVFECDCLLGLYGPECTKTVNFCKTKSDGITPIANPCKSDPLISSCAPTTNIITIPEPDVIINPGGDIQITLAGFACLQADKIGTCAVKEDVNPNFFNYACEIEENPNYVY